MCVSETLDTSRGFLEWPESYPSETIKIPCKEGGVAIRLCSITGQWEEPDLSNCRVSAAKLFKYLMMVRMVICIRVMRPMIILV